MVDSSQHFVSYAISWASIALLYYDYLLTFSLEVEHIWGPGRRILNTGTFLYVLCRYALVANILYLLGASGKLTVSCDTWHFLTATLGVFGRAAVIVTFTRRAYAMCAQNKRVLVFLASLGIATVVTDAVNVSHQGCKASSSDLISTIRSLLTIIFETSATILVTWRSIRTFLTQKRQWGFHSSTVEYFVFEQGLLYFCLISLLTFATFVLKLRGTSDFAQNLLDALTLPLSGMLTARFILHLRAWDHDHTIIVDSNYSTSLRVDLQQQGTSTTSVSIPLGRLSFGRNRELDPDQEWNEETEPAHCQDGTQTLCDR